MAAGKDSPAKSAEAGQVIDLAAIADRGPAEDGSAALEDAGAAPPQALQRPGKRRYIPLKTAGKRLRRHMALLLSLPVHDEEGLERLRRLGVADADANNSMLLCAALLGRATASGDISAFKEIRSILGGAEEEKPEADAADGHLLELIHGLKTENS